MLALQDIDFNANVKIEDVAPPDRLISGFALEMFGTPLAVRSSLQPSHKVHAVIMHPSNLACHMRCKQTMHVGPPVRLCSFTDM